MICALLTLVISTEIACTLCFLLDEILVYGHGKQEVGLSFEVDGENNSITLEMIDASCWSKIKPHYAELKGILKCKQVPGAFMDFFLSFQ